MQGKFLLVSEAKMSYNVHKKAGETMIIGIIGGGASGMAAALAAAENKENRMILFERQARVGRKLQATGNGRCNLTNLTAGSRGYHGEDPAFAEPALVALPPERTLQWFCDLGLYTVAEPSGRVYPYSDQANSVVDVLRFALQKENIQLLTGCEITKVYRCESGFSVEWDGGSQFCDKLIIACGGLAGTKLGGSMSGYKLLRSMGHHCTRLRPALVQVKSAWNGCVSLKGVRANCRAQILHDGAVTAESTGELQFTEYGLSGPVIFEISRDVCQSRGQWSCRLDFLPNLEEPALLNMLKRRIDKCLPVEELLTGVLHNRLGRVLCAAVGIKGQRTTDTLTEDELLAVCRAVKSFEVSLTDTMGMENAQVTAGGILTGEFDAHTMESKLVPGLYACGEVLDIDGDCGGFNLQWAWSSGFLAGKSAGGLL